MALTLSGLRTYGKASLPSVEEWNMAHSVVRDPPKSGRLRRVDRVTDTNETLLEAALAPDRLSDHIQLFARGVNPAVSVDFGNGGSNGGLPSSILAPRRSSYAPHRVGEVFRPPVLPLAERLPLSRQPRVATSVPSHVYDPRRDLALARWGGCDETRVASLSRDVKKALALKQAETARSVAAAFGEWPSGRRPGDSETAPFISRSPTRNLASRHVPQLDLKALAPPVQDPEALSRAAQRRADARPLLRGQRTTNLSGRPTDPASPAGFLHRDFARLASRVAPLAPLHGTTNVSKAPVHRAPGQPPSPP